MLQPQSNATHGGQDSRGFTFGVEGWSWGEPRARSITFFLDGTAMVSDQHGRPIRGSEVEGKRVMFATTSPQQNDPPGARSKLGTHQQVVAALEVEGVDWKQLVRAGWPQLPYEELKALPQLPPWPFALQHDPTLPICRCIRCSVKDKALRKASRLIQQELEEEKAAELAAVEAEDE